MEIFGQLLEMDDDDSDREFSKSLASNYMDQAEASLKEMEEALKGRYLNVLSQKGHFLKGSSAALGLLKVTAICENMQQAGLKRADDGRTDISEAQALSRCASLLSELKVENATAENWLKDFYKPS